MTSAELREKFLTFFKARGHAVIPSASLVPADSTVLFTTAGMQPLVPFLLGETHPKGTRLVNYQKCLRTGDIEEVGDDTHLTFFEMLGNWSLGDYWKKESISWSFEFLTKELHIPLDRLAVSCFAGDSDAPTDKESAEIWESLGIAKERIAFLGKEDNWWGPVGDSGPCGPDTEIFYWKDNEVSAPEVFDPTDKNWVEIWNNVFMQYLKLQNGQYLVAEQKNVDTGMGLERIVAVLNGKKSVYETDIFEDILALIPQTIENKKRRIIADHARAIAFLISDGVTPSNKDQGYILRRLIRRLLVNKEVDFYKIFDAIVTQYHHFYPQLDDAKIADVFVGEAQKFTISMEEGLRRLAKMKSFNAKEVFSFYDTYGLPLDVLRDKVPGFNQADFDDLLKKHQELSRTASAGMFKGGLADHDPKTIRLHTAHHLLLAALQQVLGKEVKQKGSNITQERLRLDFSFGRKLTDEEKKRVEDLVNEKIKEGLPVVRREMPKEEAEKLGAQMEFGVKYGNTVSVYFIEEKNGDAFSKEFCGGPHVSNTSELGDFKILKEEASGQGVRRIKAMLQ